MNRAKGQTHINRPRINCYQALSLKNDRKTEELLQTSSQTPLGQLLEKISKLPEVRTEKVINLRRQICNGQYKVDEKLDATIDKILEDLLIEP
jgi:anti-sigma28 factor (negative regulator of flagellin synthesis)